MVKEQILNGVDIAAVSELVKDVTDPNAMKGFAVVKAESIEAAVEIAKSDPVLDIGGTIRVSQMMEMS